jgi:prepilin-type N-terminal cleavage/methylation domain-containing protein
VIAQVRPVHKIVGKARGLSLVELLAAVTIVGILVASAVPVYRHFIVKAKMAEGESAVLDVRTLQQQYYINTHLYTTDLSALGYAPMPSLRYYSMEVRLGDPADPSELHYQVVAKAKFPELDHWYLSVYGDGREDLRHGPPD